MLNAPSRSPFAIERSLSDDGVHVIAFAMRCEFFESMTNALVAHLQGLEVLVKGDLFHALPAIPISRSVAEVAASFAWLFDPEGDHDQRAACTYAAAFRYLEKSNLDLAGEGEGQRAPIREKLIEELAERGVRVVRQPRTVPPMALWRR